MNVKFRMPKLSAEEAATQGGTAAWLEKREAEKATR